MKKIAFFDTKPYDKEVFDEENTHYEMVYFESKLNEKTARLAQGFDCVCAFVNDDINQKVIDTLYENGIRLIALRSAGYNNVDLKAAQDKITIVRVPSYSPHSIAEHAFSLLQTLNRKIHRAYIRTRDFNFSLVGMNGIVLYQKTIGIVGVGAIGRAMIQIAKGYGMRVVCFDPHPDESLGVEFVDLDTLFKESDVISLHCPLTKATYHMINKESIAKMKKGVYFINTSRGALVDTASLLDALNEGKIRGAGLDVYEEEEDLFFEDKSLTIVKDNILSLLISRPNVIVTSHQAFLTDESLTQIARTTFDNLDQYFAHQPLENEIRYQK
ncbi:d-isomer specific 2-hydroxyacid dehydrogenase NAD-binding [Coprobacillus sp. CAG:826]|nr:2-hydroxyacid dehydrogenase [Coprobacillus sp.]CDD92121.1 d-isomer specific 2-hydroxyacid dehydrogenase NAD-binding [Coprobacillus sp. CAG:826]